MIIILYRTANPDYQNVMAETLAEAENILNSSQNENDVERVNGYLEKVVQKKLFAIMKLQELIITQV